MDVLKSKKDSVASELTRYQSNNVINFQGGKVPPQAIDLEEVILGGMMIDKKGVDEVIDILQVDAFYEPAHKYIYQSILTLFKESKPIDLKTVVAQLREDGKLDASGGLHYIIKLTNKVSSTAHIEYYARVVIEKYIMRSLISVSSEIIERCYDETSDVFDLLDGAESKLYDITQGNIKRSTETSQDLVIEVKKRIEEISKKQGVSGIPSGFTSLDRITSGWQPSDLIIVAARPGMGKTTMCLSMARNISVDRNIPLALFSLEMSSLQLMTRLVSSETGLPSEILRTGKLQKHEWEQLHLKVKNLEKAPLYIDDTPSLSIFDLRAKARRLTSKYDIKLIIVDYLQLMTVGVNNKSGNREQEISTISRNLKALAKELEIPIIALSQLSRAVEHRSGDSKRPQLSDLRESGAIEQDADIVSFIYRPEYYKLEVWDDEEQTPTKGEAELIIAKHRNGSLDNIRLKFLGHLGRFENLDYSFEDKEYESKINISSMPNTQDQLKSAFSSGKDLEDSSSGHRNSDDQQDDVPF